MRHIYIKTKANDSGNVIFTMFLVFIPIYLLSLVLLIDASRIQSLKTINDIVSRTVANSAIRQVDYDLLRDGQGILIREHGSDISFTGKSSAGIQKLHELSRTQNIDRVNVHSLVNTLWFINMDLNHLQTSPSFRTDNSVEIIVLRHNDAYFDPTLKRTIVIRGPAAVRVISETPYTATPFFGTVMQLEDSIITVRSQSVSQIIQGRTFVRD